MPPKRVMLGRLPRLFRAVAPLILLFTLQPKVCHAWGVTGHRYVNGLAVDCLPDTLRPLFEANRAWIVQHAADPDEWRRTNFATESPRHYIDLDSAGAVAYPEDYWTAVGMFGQAFVTRHGIAPWRVGEYYGKLVRAYRKQDGRAIVEISTWLGHYVGDLHVPFHATANYDGQLSGQKGIHGRFELNLIDQLIKADDLRPREAVAVKDPVASAFAWARESLALCPELLAADKRAILKDADFGYNYLTEFALTARPIVIHRLEQSAQNTASLWLSAWIDAGRPPVPPAADVHPGESAEQHTRDPDEPAPGSSRPSQDR